MTDLLPLMNAARASGVGRCNRHDMRLLSPRRKSLGIRQARNGAKLLLGLVPVEGADGGCEVS